MKRFIIVSLNVITAIHHHLVQVVQVESIYKMQDVLVVAQLDQQLLVQHADNAQIIAPNVLAVQVNALNAVVTDSYTTINVSPNVPMDIMVHLTNATNVQVIVKHAVHRIHVLHAKMVHSFITANVKKHVQPDIIVLKQTTNVIHVHPNVGHAVAQLISVQHVKMEHIYITTHVQQNVQMDIIHHVPITNAMNVQIIA